MVQDIPVRPCFALMVAFSEPLAMVCAILILYIHTAAASPTCSGLKILLCSQFILTVMHTSLLFVIMHRTNV